MSNESNQYKNGLWDWVKAISTLVVVGVVSYKVYLTPINLVVDFPTLLSLLLALFSVALAALFYFKATETSNTFYDNINNFTKDIAHLLVKMESGFGERLRNLDEGYSSMRDSLQHYSDKPNVDEEKIKKKIKNEKKEMENMIQERNKVIKSLIDRSNLQQEEKFGITKDLEEKENALAEAQKELLEMNRRLRLLEKNRLGKNISFDFDTDVIEYTRSRVLRKIGVRRILGTPQSHVQKRFDSMVSELPRGYIKDLEREGFFENGLTNKGYHLLKALVEREDA